MALGPGLTEKRIDQDGSYFYVNFRNSQSDYEKRLKDYKVGLLPFIEERIKKNEIKFIKEFYDDVDTNFSLSLEERQRIKDEFKTLIDTTFQNPTDDVLKLLKIPRGGVEYQNATAATNASYGVLNRSLKTALEKKINANVEYSFSLDIRGADYQTVDNLLETVAQTGNIAELKSAQAGEGKDSDSVLSKSPPLEVRQCALMSIMYSKWNLENLMWQSYQSGNDGEDRGIFDQRITPFIGSNTYTDLKASEINNYFTADDQIKNFFNHTVEDTELNKALFFVYHDINDKKMKEIKLKLSSHDDKSIKNDRLDEIYQIFLDAENGVRSLNTTERENLEAEKRALFARLTVESKITEKDEEGNDTQRTVLTESSTGEGENIRGVEASQLEGNVIETFEITKENPKPAPFQKYNNFHTEKISIKFNGTNPSTARNDVQVSVVMQLETFASLEASLIEGGIASTGRTDFKVKDLIIAPIGSDSQTGALAAITNIYSPSSNRVRLKVKASPGTSGIDQPPLVLDLALVDHSLARATDSNAVTLTINYRGYMETLMQMPYANVLMTKEIYKKRKDRHAKIKELLTLGCNDTTLREILRVERSTAEIEVGNNFSNIIGKLYSDDRVYSYSKKDDSSLTFTDIASNIVRHGINHEITVYSGRSDWNGNWLLDIAGAEEGAEADKDALERVAQNGVEDTAGITEPIVNASTRNEDGWLVGSRKVNNFIFFGDLLYTVTDILYAQAGSEHTIPEIKENLEFLLFPIQIPDPSTVKGFIEINPAVIPIDLYFFAEWWHEKVVKKELTNYPIAAFIRDLAERLINNLLYEVCVSNLLPDEQPPMLKVSYFSSQKSAVIKPSAGESYPNYLNNGFYAYDLVPKPFFRSFFDPNDITTNNPKEISAYNYIVMHVMSPPFRREISVKENNQQLRYSKFVPTLIHGVFTRDKGSHVDTVTFSKTNSPGLREARFFNNTFGNVAIMNNVYDLSFAIQDNNANTYLYPGMIINFVLTDFEMGYSRDESTGRLIAAKVDQTTYINSENDPHKSTSLAHTLGYGGYFLIKSVNYDLLKGSSGGKWQITCEAKFIGTDGDQRVKQEDRDIRSIIQSDKEDCIKVYDFAVQENQTAVGEYNTNNEDNQITQDFSTIGGGERPPDVTDPPPNESEVTDEDLYPQSSNVDDVTKVDQSGDNGKVAVVVDVNFIKGLDQAKESFVTQDKYLQADGSTYVVFFKAGDKFFKAFSEGGTVEVKDLGTKDPKVGNKLVDISDSIKESSNPSSADP